MTLTIPLTRVVTNTSALLDLGLTSLILESSILRGLRCYLNSASYCLSLGSFLVHVCLRLSIPSYFILPFFRVNGVLSHNSNFPEHTERAGADYLYLKTSVCYEKAYLIHLKKNKKKTWLWRSVFLSAAIFDCRQSHTNTQIHPNLVCRVLSGFN